VSHSTIAAWKTKLSAFRSRIQLLLLLLVMLFQLLQLVMLSQLLLSHLLLLPVYNSMPRVHGTSMQKREGHSYSSSAHHMPSLHRMFHCDDASQGAMHPSTWCLVRDGPHSLCGAMCGAFHQHISQAKVRRFGNLAVAAMN